MQIGLMVEGQNGLTWERWTHILALAERLRFPTVFRSDHYFTGPQRESLDAYLSFVLAARETRSMRFGPLVTPVTFRRAIDIGKMAAQLDVLSGGRFVMGLGIGWNVAEHKAYGLPFPGVRERFERLEEAILLMKALWKPGAGSFQGRHYQMENVDCRPKPAAGRPPILIGGQGERQTLRLVAKYADEWNSPNLLPQDYARKKAVLEQHCQAVGRDPKSIRRSVMIFSMIGPDQKLVEAATRKVMEMFGGRGPNSIKDFQAWASSRGMLVGQTEEALDRLGRFAELGVREVQLQHLDFASDELPEYIASDIVPRAARL